MPSFEVRPKQREHRCVVHFHEEDACFSFVVAGDNGIVGCGGGERELTSVGQLVEASKVLIDWADDLETLRALALLERSTFDKDTRRILDRVFV